VTFHWNRHHTARVVAIVNEMNTYRHPDELIAKLANIRMTNKCGSLARRFTFLSHHPSRVKPGIPREALSEYSGADVEVELVPTTTTRAVV
jgi:hypothetical protein